MPDAPGERWAVRLDWLREQGHPIADELIEAIEVLRIAELRRAAVRRAAIDLVDGTATELPSRIFDGDDPQWWIARHLEGLELFQHAHGGEDPDGQGRPSADWLERVPVHLDAVIERIVPLSEDPFGERVVRKAIAEHLPPVPVSGGETAAAEALIDLDLHHCREVRLWYGDEQRPTRSVALTIVYGQAARPFAPLAEAWTRLSGGSFSLRSDRAKGTRVEMVFPVPE